MCQAANAPLHRRNQPAKKVVVTGSFDDWSKSESLDKVDDGFEKAVRIDDGSDKIYYKVSGIPLLGAIRAFGCSYSLRSLLRRSRPRVCGNRSQEGAVGLMFPPYMCRPVIPP